MAEQIELDVNIREEDGMYWAEVPSHPGLFASGATMDELLDALGEAWSLYRSGMESRPAAHPAARSLKVLLPA